jgi:hypothetical protein
MYILKNQEIIDRCIAEIKESHGMMVTIQKPNKTAAQRNYWHKLIRIVADYQGESEEMKKAEIKIGTFEPEGFLTYKNYLVVVPISSEKLSKQDYGLLIDKTIAQGQELELNMPLSSYFGVDI